MTYPIYTQTEKLLNEGSNYTERRVISINWFEGVCPEDFRPTTAEPNKVQADGVGDTKERKFTKVSEMKIQDIP